MSETKLKPCPFCGGKAKMVKYCSKKTIVYVECTNCLAYMGNQRIITSYNRGKEYFESEEKLINAWNTRTPMANIVEKLEERRIEYELSSENAPDAVSSTYRKGVMRGYEYSRDLVKRETNNGLE